MICAHSPVAPIGKALEEVSSAMGITLDDLVALLMTGITITNLADYAEAVISNRLS